MTAFRSDYIVMRREMSNDFPNHDISVIDIRCSVSKNSVYVLEYSVKRYIE
jgi:hypothetical protein